MANNRPIDKTKKSNIKCEHCEFYKDNECFCNSNVVFKTNYWNRCGSFQWSSKLVYKESDEE